MSSSSSSSVVATKPDRDAFNRIRHHVIVLDDNRIITGIDLSPNGGSRFSYKRDVVVPPSLSQILDRGVSVVIHINHKERAMLDYAESLVKQGMGDCPVIYIGVLVDLTGSDFWAVGQKILDPVHKVQLKPIPQSGECSFYMYQDPSTASTKSYAAAFKDIIKSAIHRHIASFYVRAFSISTLPKILSAKNDAAVSSPCNLLRTTHESAFSNQSLTSTTAKKQQAVVFLSGLKGHLQAYNCTINNVNELNAYESLQRDPGIEMSWIPILRETERMQAVFFNSVYFQWRNNLSVFNAKQFERGIKDLNI